ncbi:MAG TPA: DUF4055 domain-containing protein [Verrucomicrobiae bacterium]|nr:DUF4055 domain-containing protein [Verrucomicrobiae bacterium]
MPVDSTHPDYDASLPPWLRARDVLAGEDAVKVAGEKYLPRLESQSDDEYKAYRARAAFFNASARTAEGFIGLVCRRPPFIKVPEPPSAIGRALGVFVNDADMLGTTLASYGQTVVTELIAVGRAGTLVDWEGEVENRVYVSRYVAEDILNWKTERINGRNLLTLVVLHEMAEIPKPAGKQGQGDEFEVNFVEQIRVLKLVVGRGQGVGNKRKKSFECQVEIWQLLPQGRQAVQKAGGKKEWRLVETRIPLRRGKPLPLIPFIFHGPRNSLPEVCKLPLGDIVFVNLDHYRLDADYKHGMHFTALPTAWVSGFDKSATLRIGSSTAWVTETTGATAGFLEYTGQGLTTFERAMDRDERLMAVLGARLLEGQRRVGETAQAIELRQSGENSILSNLAMSASSSLTQVMRWAYWWNSTEDLPDHVTNEQVVMELNTDFAMTGMTAQELTAVVGAWQKGAISRDTMLHLFRKGEILPEGRTTEEEAQLIEKEKPAGP